MAIDDRKRRGTRKLKRERGLEDGFALTEILWQQKGQRGLEMLNLGFFRIYLHSDPSKTPSFYVD